jgi:tetratricopeptide (TPR) repeat protein
MSSRRRRVSWLLILFCSIPGLAAAQPLGRLVGRVVDPEGRPIPGVSVTVTSSDVPKFREVRTTDKRGGFTVDFREMDVTYQYRFDKEGYQTLQAQQRWSLEGTQRFTWTMTPGRSAAGISGAPPATTSEPAVLAYNAAVAAARAGDLAAAEAKFKEAVGHDPKLIQGWAALSSIQLQTGNFKEAASSAEQAIALGSTDEVVLTTRWQAYRSLKDDAKAAEALKELERVGRRAEEAKKVHNEAVALVKAGDQAGAFAKFQEALSLDPTLQASQLGLSTAALKLGRNAEAATAAEAVLKADPKNEAALRLRYNACLALGDAERLAEALVGLAAVEPTIAKNGLLKLAFEAYDANDQAKARARFLKVLDVDPNQPLAHYYVALVYVNEGNTKEAMSHLEKFIALSPNTKEAETAREMLKQLAKIKGA